MTYDDKDLGRTVDANGVVVTAPAETDALVKDLVVVNPDEITIVPGDDTIVYLQLPKDVEGETLPAEAALPKEGISA